ncbi:hypothetical protein TOPH_08063 [Tolypocladium ophioglossoides CBS 100239]|uniref:C2H2-type domain-containing protein n=1 Tax=Tolypocladium ophioglossoides (strain CBS 100239) TaxID=1163406 RepID=A0A0L0MZF9_TOLOC|nr:hypothetical protein TOPH_08063 [Tolypocladium ophioglossoides CBS 100239]
MDKADEARQTTRFRDPQRLNISSAEHVSPRIRLTRSSGPCGVVPTSAFRPSRRPWFVVPFSPLTGNCCHATANGKKAPMSSASTAADCEISYPDAEQNTTPPKVSPESCGSKLSPCGPDFPVCCLYPGCTAEPFNGCTDLDRHYKQHHTRNPQNRLFYCDYPQCTRSFEPFHRLNRLRDHLRKVHKESIGDLPATIHEGMPGDGQAATKWWRCAPCLKRVDLDRHGHECPGCKLRQETKRKEPRHGD